MDHDEYQIMTTGGIPGPTWRCDDQAEAVALAEEHGYDVLDTVEGDIGGTFLIVAGEKDSPCLSGCRPSEGDVCGGPRCC